MADNRIVIIGGSAGSIPALITMMKDFPVDFRPPIIIVLHRSHADHSMLAEILQKKTAIKVKEIQSFDTLNENTIFLAPADYHLLVNKNGKLELDYSEKVLYSRPSIDVSLISFASAFGEKLIAIILSGANSDGALGANLVKRQGGKLIVQSPDDADSPTMPRESLKINPDADAVVPANQIVNTLVKLINT